MVRDETCVCFLVAVWLKRERKRDREGSKFVVCVCFGLENE